MGQEEGATKIDLAPRRWPEQKGRRIASLQAPRSKRIAVPFTDDCGTVPHLV
jgi:hypothetical protein